MQTRTAKEQSLRRTATAVLSANWTGRHTVPSRTLYPHQWSWDSGFVAIGLARVAPERGWRDLRSLFEAQWPDGRVPHIVFDPGVPERDYFPGPSFWRLPGSSGIVQPPVHALAAWELYRAAPGAAGAAELEWLYPRLVAQQDYLATRRDVGGAGLVSIVHPWESGLDNSPAWDAALADVPVPAGTMNGYRRRDNQVAAGAHRPTDQDYARYVALASAYRDGGYQDFRLATGHPFVVECPGFNTLYGLAELALARIAGVVGADPVGHREWAGAITRSIDERLHDPRTGMFHARDVRTGRLGPARCVNGLLPLALPGLPAERVAGLVAALTSPRFGLSPQLPVPSYDRTAPGFDPVRYWRGPIWLNVNWLLWRGLRAHGRTTLADVLRTALLNLVARSGCYEYFHADTGLGVGAASFSWTAALALDLLLAPG
jgi:hypothetical protein